MRLKVVAFALAVCGLALAMPALAQDQAPSPATSPAPAAAPAPSAGPAPAAAVAPVFGGSPGIAAAQATANPTAAAREPLAAIAVGLGLLGARYLRLRSH